MNSPRDILEYVINENLESEFLLSVSRFKNNYTIGEIGDGKFTVKDGVTYFKSHGFNINVPVDDDNVSLAVSNKQYISSFISRKDNSYNVHFLVHKYPASMKVQFDEIIVKEVIQYMILKTIVALRLDTIEKVNAYIH